MWGVGCLLSMLLVGRPPFDAKNGKQLVEHIYRVRPTHPPTHP